MDLVERVRDVVLAVTFGDGDTLHDYLGMMSDGDGGLEDGELIARAAIATVLDALAEPGEALQGAVDAVPVGVDNLHEIWAVMLAYRRKEML
jgi:hypothetical protein